jgi:chaperonin GroES
MKVKPIGDRVLVKIQESETKTAGGIIIPQTAQEKTQTGLVVAVGAGSKNDKGVLEPVPVSEGQKIMYDKYAGTQIKIDGVDHLIVKAQDILAILE